MRIITNAMLLFYCITIFCCMLQCYTKMYCKKPNNNIATKEDYVMILLLGDDTPHCMEISRF